MKKALFGLVLATMLALPLSCINSSSWFSTVSTIGSIAAGVQLITNVLNGVKTQS